jgi:hypothetical protein
MNVLMSFAAVLLISLPAHAATPFGFNGRTGQNGETGRDGRDGFSTTITAAGRPVSLTMNGEAGTDGSDGQMGEDAYQCVQTTPADNVYGAKGGIGGTGGTPGNGGNGGDLTIYTDKIDNLNSVIVISEPGQGGRVGRSSYGGRGCLCTTPSWQANVCKMDTQPDGTAKQVCNTETFSCTNGANGTDGPPSGGSFGSSGREGKLTLIPQLDTLQPDQTSVTIKLPAILQGSLNLSKNQWTTQSGALRLLAPGSQLSDIYTVFVGRQSWQYNFTWNMSRSIADFTDVQLSLGVLASDGMPHVSLSDSVWYKSHQTSTAAGGTNQVSFVFDNMIFESEAENLKLSVQGSDTNITAVVLDAASLSDLVDTGFEVTFSKVGFWSDKTLFQGFMPPALIVRQGQTFVLQLGKLPGIDPQYLAAGTKLEVDLQSRRSLGGFSSQVPLNSRYNVPQN